MSQNKYLKKELPASLNKIGWMLLVVGAALGLLGFYVDHSRAVYSYLVAYMFLVSLGVGSVFLLALEYVAGADWSVPFRRIIEFTGFITPFLLILAIPLLFNLEELFQWAQPQIVAKDEILTGKSPYLNTEFFIIRVVVFILIWSAFYFLMSRNSLKQDVNGDQKLTKINIKLSAIFIPLFALTISFTSFDWMMSLEPHWFSTIFGVYFFSGTVIAALASATIFAIPLKEKGYLHSDLNNEHLFSFGALLFAFVNFWAYIAFSQYLLIWYADLPEETTWFLTRWQGSWAYFSILLIVIHFLVPYIILLSQPAKMDPKRLKFSAVWLLFAHLFDLFWLIMPSVHSMEHGYIFSWIDLVFPIAAVGIVIILFTLKAKNNNLIPVGDPKLEKGLNFHL
jgi:hypothetical protein